MKGKIKLVVGLLFATAVVAQAALFVENFNSYDPTTDTTVGGLGRGQLEDVAGSTWSGVDTDVGNFQTLVAGTAGEQNLQIKSIKKAGQLNNSATFAAQDQASAFSFHYNLERWGNNGTGAGNGSPSRLEIGLRNSASDNNVFGLEILVGNGAPAKFRTFVYDYTGGARNEILDTADGTGGTLVAGVSVGSLSFIYDGAGNMVLNVYAGVNQTGSILQSVSGTTSGSAFSADSLFINVSTTSDNGKMDVQVDDLTVAAIPEPATLGMVLLMGGGLFFVRRRIKM